MVYMLGPIVGHGCHRSPLGEEQDWFRAGRSVGSRIPGGMLGERAGVASVGRP